MTKIKPPGRAAGYFLDSFGTVFLVALVPALILGELLGSILAILGGALAALWFGPNMKIDDTTVTTRHYFRPVRRSIVRSEIVVLDAVLRPRRWEGTGRGAQGVTAVLRNGERIPLLETASFSGEDVVRKCRVLGAMLGVETTA
jgi:hypothetical protein